MRYDQLLPLIAHCKPKKIAEVGTWNGHRAIVMATEALKHQPKVHYIGFDLFETATGKTDTEEMNVKKHHTLKEVTAELDAFAANNSGFTFDLHKGNTRKTMKGRVKGLGVKGKSVDLAFIDGGHSVETIKGDHEALRNAKVIVFDDYYEDGPDTKKFGCNSVVETLDSLILQERDPIKGGGFTKMAVSPSSAWPGKIRMVVKTRNCVPPETIVDNVLTNTPKMAHWIRECDTHGRKAVVVSGGPSFKNYIEDIRQHIADGDFVFCVKTSHDALLAEGIVPFGCLLLDPRPHVLDFVEKPHPSVNYMVASMVHPDTLSRIKEHGARVVGYHAFVGAGEKDALEKGSILIGGGSTAACRGISVLHALGFREFELYGFESSYPKKPSKTHGIKKKDPMRVEVLGRTFWTDAELLAQAQDFERMLGGQQEINIVVHGDGMIPHIWDCVRSHKGDMLEVFNG